MARLHQRLGFHSLRVGGERYRIKTMCCADAQQYNGMTEPEYLTISLAPVPEAEQLGEVVIHEVLHAIAADRLVPVGVLKGRGDWEEKIVEGFSRGLAQVFSANPALLRFLVRCYGQQRPGA